MFRPPYALVVLGAELGAEEAVYGEGQLAAVGLERLLQAREVGLGVTRDMRLAGQVLHVPLQFLLQPGDKAVHLSVLVAVEVHHALGQGGQQVVNKVLATGEGGGGPGDASAPVGVVPESGRPPPPGHAGRHGWLPVVKTLDAFDFTAQPSLNQALVRELLRG